MEELNQVQEQQNTTQVREQDTHLEENGTQAEVKMFTQDEVDKIVSQRLARERKKFEDTLREYTGSPLERELAKREREVARRELRAEARFILQERGEPLEILNLLDYTDEESCMESLERITSTVKRLAEESVNNVLRGDGPPKAGHKMVTDAIRKAMGLERG